MSSDGNYGTGSARQVLLFGLKIDALRMPEVVHRCGQALKARRPMAIGVINAAKTVYLREDPILRNSLVECDMILADGQSIVWASKLFGKPLPERVAGIDLFEQLLHLAHRDGWSVYLLGATEDVLHKLEANLQVRYPGLRIAGRRDGYFKDDEGPEIAAAIRASNADMLFVGMNSPKKEIFQAKYGKMLDVTILHGVGGSFDVMAGITSRAPLLWQRTGMEWLYRLLQEPRRMMRRYVTTNWGFLVLTFREYFHATPPVRSAIVNELPTPKIENQLLLTE